MAQLSTFDLDDGSPRNTRPGKLVDAVLAGLHLTVVDDVDRAVEVDDTVREAVATAIAKVLDVELAIPRLRDAIISYARTRCDERYFVAFEKLSAQLDERGMRFVKQLKLPLDSVQAVERVLFEARAAVIGEAARSALDRAREVLARASEEAAARLDQPITQRLTPRDVAVLRATDPRLLKLPAVVTAALVDALTELVNIRGRAAERAARPYAASATFAVGETVEHVKFGRGTVTAVKAARIDVKFDDATRTLVHAPPK